MLSVPSPHAPSATASSTTQDGVEVAHVGDDAPLRVFISDVYFSVNEKLLERLQARLCGAGRRPIELETNIKKADTCDLVIGDRHGIPYHLVRTSSRRAVTGAAPLINFFEGAQRLTLKVSMAQLLKDFPAADRFCPKSFVLVPKSGDDDADASQQVATPLSSTVSSSSSFSAVPLQETGTNGTGAIGGPAEKPRRASALPSKAERMAMAAGKAAASASSSPAANADEREQLAAEMSRNPDTVWIAKPTAGAKGIGILLARDFDTLIAHVETFNPQTALSHDQTFGATAAAAASSNVAPSASAINVTNNKKSSRTRFLVQKYIDRPLLVRGQRKFDIRVWCALSSPKYDVFVFSEGSCRTASVPYSGTADLSNQFAHVTNHDLQQYAPGYGEFEAGNEMWYDALASHIQAVYAGRLDQLRERSAALMKEIRSTLIATPDHTARAAGCRNIFEELIRPQMHYVVVQSFLAARHILEVDHFARFQAFQMFGFDLMLDDELNVHLLEINGAPGVAQSLLAPCVDGAIDALIAPRVPGVAAGIPPMAHGAAGARGCWEKVYSA